MFADLVGYNRSGRASGSGSPDSGHRDVPLGEWTFLPGAVSEIRSLKPGMMLLIALAITVAFFSS